MTAPLIERECIPDTFCVLFVNNFYFSHQRAPFGNTPPDCGAGGGVMPIDT
jgi:hypothetical protein